MDDFGCVGEFFVVWEGCNVGLFVKELVYVEFEVGYGYCY